MTSRKSLHRPACLLASFALAGANAAAAQDGGELKPSPAQFPAVTYACQVFALPADDAAAEAAVDAARTAWLAAAEAAKLEKASPLFIDGDVTAKAPGQTVPPPLPVRLCAIVPSGSTVAGLQVEAQPARAGVAGFCTGLEVKTCLAKAAKDAGYSDAKPWPKLPVFGRWPLIKPMPTAAADIVAHLSTYMIDANQVAAGEGATVEYSTGVVPLVRCDANSCPKPPTPQVVDPAGIGVAWFLPVPPPPPKADPPPK